MTTATPTKTVEYTHASALDSSVLKQAIYNAATHHLYLKFHNGTIAGYGGVSKSVYDGLVESYSAGAFYNSYIRGQYTGIDGNVAFVRSRQPEAPKAPKSVYVVKGLVSAVITAHDLEDAVRQFNNIHDNAEVKEVTVRFD